MKTNENVKAVNKNLDDASKYQKKSKKKYIILAIIIVIIIVVVAGIVFFLTQWLDWLYPIITIWLY